MTTDAHSLMTLYKGKTMLSCASGLSGTLLPTTSIMVANSPSRLASRASLSPNWVKRADTSPNALLWQSRRNQIEC
jgi:hypothetical protein